MVKINAAARVRVAASVLMDTAVFIEALGIKLHPMGAGSSFMSNGLVGSATSDQVKALRRAVAKKGWKASVPPEKTARRDGVWLADLKVHITGGELAYVFVAKPNAEGRSDILVKTKTVKPV